HSVLDVNLLGLIARPCAIEPGEKAFFFECSELLAVSEIAPLMLRSEKEPVVSFCSGRLAFLQIRAKRRHSGSGTDHDDWNVRAVWKVKMLRHTGVNRDRDVIRAFGEKRGANSFAKAPVAFIADHVHDKVNLFRICL